jgi:hypothetical protein
MEAVMWLPQMQEGLLLVLWLALWLVLLQQGLFRGLLLLPEE